MIILPLSISLDETGKIHSCFCISFNGAVFLWSLVSDIKSMILVHDATGVILARA